MQNRLILIVSQCEKGSHISPPARQSRATSLYTGGFGWYGKLPKLSFRAERQGRRRIYAFCFSLQLIGAKILRLPPVAQDDILVTLCNFASCLRKPIAKQQLIYLLHQIDQHFCFIPRFPGSPVAPPQPGLLPSAPYCPGWGKRHKHCRQSVSAACRNPD